MATLLLHTCCAPCSTYTVEHWRKEKLEVAAFWFNPNIHPTSEQELRLKAMQNFSKAVELPLFLPPGYDREDIECLVSGEGERCARCFLWRLSQTAAFAREKGFDAFSTTLLISPYQKHELLREVAERVAREAKIPFLYADLHSGFPRSRRLSRELNLYRQKYCGCLFSEWERFGGMGDVRLRSSSFAGETSSSSPLLSGNARG